MKMCYNNMILQWRSIIQFSMQRKFCLLCGAYIIDASFLGSSSICTIICSTSIC